MPEATRARRSSLSVPGSSPKMLGKAPGLPADEVFMDLEDSVAPGEKEAARKNVIAALKDNDFGDKTVVVRINGVVHALVLPRHHRGRRGGRRSTSTAS